MSFILDALKKSENARQRQAGPAMAELPRRRRQNERPVWAFVVAGLLLVNIGVLALVLARKKGGDVQPVAAAAATSIPIDPTSQQQIPVQPSAAVPGPQVQQAQQPFPQPEPLQVPQINPNGYAVSSLAAESGMRNDFDVSLSPEDEEMLRRIERAQEQISQENLSAAATLPIQAPAVAPLSGVAQRPVVAGRVIGGNGSVPATQEEILPTVNELSASGRTFPNMRLDIHSFADNPSERFVFVNMRRYNEGQTLQEGPAVERITVEGVVLNQQGLRFLLPRP